MSNPKIVIEIQEHENETHFGVGVMLDVSGVTKEPAIKNYFAIKLKEAIVDAIQNIRNELQEKFGESTTEIDTSGSSKIPDDVNTRKLDFNN